MRQKLGFRPVAVVRETSPPEPGAQLKYYARRLGLIKIEAEDDPQAENLTLVERLDLGPGALAIARQNVRRLEFNAYFNENQNISDVYWQTYPAVQIEWD
jgi:hypothetical protein